jgi:hypothetical protein
MGRPAKAGGRKVLVSAKIEPEVMARLREAAEADRRSISSLVEIIVDEYLARLDEGQEPPEVDHAVNNCPKLIGRCFTVW